MMMSRFDFVKVTFTPIEWAIVGKPVNAERYGGAQRALAKMLQRVNAKTLSVELSPVEIATFEKYARHNEEKGGGGYQTRFKTILEAVARARE